MPFLHYTILMKTWGPNRVYGCYHLWQVLLYSKAVICYTIEIVPVGNITEDIDYSGAEKSDIYVLHYIQY